MTHCSGSLLGVHFHINYGNRRRPFLYKLFQNQGHTPLAPIHPHMAAFYAVFTQERANAARCFPPSPHVPSGFPVLSRFLARPQLLTR
jgi:hypothetical protein